MRRVVVLGNGGSGKSTFARELGARTGLPVIHLDSLYWGPGWTPKPDAEWEAIQRDLVGSEEWIIDGNYSRSFDIRLPRADTVVFLDVPRLVCLWAVTRRWLAYRGVARPDMAPGLREKLDLEFLRWIWGYQVRTRPKVLERLAGLASRASVVHLTSRREAREWLEQVGPQGPAA